MLPAFMYDELDRLKKIKKCKIKMSNLDEYQILDILNFY